MGRRPGLAAAVSRWALGGLSPGELGRRAYRRSREDEILERAAAAYGVTDNRTWVRRRLIALALTLGFSVFILTAMLMLVFGERIGEAIGDWFGLDSISTRAWHLLQWPIVAFLGLTGLTIVYHLAPAARRGWRWITPGSALALVSWLAMSP